MAPKKASRFASKHTVLRIGPPCSSFSQVAVRAPLMTSALEEPASSSAGPSCVPAPRLLPPRRADAPVVRPYTTGAKQLALDIARSPLRRAEAVNALKDATYAKTSIAPRAARQSLWTEVLVAAGFSKDDLSPEAVDTVTAVLHAAGYRSAPQVLGQALADAKRDGIAVPDATWARVPGLRRALRRGAGAPKKTAPFPLDRAGELSGAPAPLAPGGPVHPRRFLVAGSWWLAREIELSNATVGDISDDPTGGVSWNMPVSKSDIAALGASRSHRCICGQKASAPALAPAVLCPACTLAAQRAFRLTDGAALDDPLFPDDSGQFVTKRAAVRTIEKAASAIGLPLAAPSGAPLWGGHALRRGGAQFLARAGVEVWRIQALARHSSDAILGYIENVHVQCLNNVAAEAYVGRSIDTLRHEANVLRAVAATCQAPEPSAPARAPSPEASAQAAPCAPAQAPPPCAPAQGYIVATGTHGKAPVPSAPARAPSPEGSAQAAPCAPALAPSPRAPAQGYIVATGTYGKQHVTHKHIAGLTRCGWAWARHSRFFLTSDAGAAPECRHCASRPSGRAAAAADGIDECDPHGTSCSSGSDDSISSGSDSFSPMDNSISSGSDSFSPTRCF